MSELSLSFYKGKENILENEGPFGGSSEKKEPVKLIREEIVKIFPASNLSFLLGAGCSSLAIPTMQGMSKEILNDLNLKASEIPTAVKEYITNNENVEDWLSLLFSAQDYLMTTGSDANILKSIEECIKKIKEKIYTMCTDTKENNNKVLEIYNSFYRRLMYRDRALKKINIFTTNYDLFNERAMDDLGIIYCNGFSGFIDRYFNPSTFDYAYAEQIGIDNHKYNVIDSYVYLYKLHGSVSWIEIENNDKLFKVKEVQNSSKENNHMMIYPTPLKQSNSFGAPYSDLFREFQKKILMQDSVLVVIGYSFADEHINNIIYQALASIPKFRLIIFCHDELNTEIEKLKNKDDPRIWIIKGNDTGGKNIAGFEYIVEHFLLEINKDDKELEDILKKYYRKND